MTQTRPPSLSDELAEASDLATLNALIAKGRDFQFASQRTRNRWDRIATRRREELQQGKNGAQR